ncbi:MAG: hypothetical protein ACREEW_13760 [Caulobacteraceae bacterium]
MADLLDGLIDRIVEGALRGAVTKTVNGWVASGYVAATQAPTLEVGMMDEIQVALAMWERSQKPPA